MKSVVSYSDFEKLDFRVGEVIYVSEPDWSNKLLKFEVDFGILGKRIIFSGIRKWYKVEDFLNKKFVFLFNMENKKMGPSDSAGRREASEGMMIMADGEESPVIIPVSDEIEVGTVVR
jgi:methionyl-tRNA synthetase